MSLEEKTRANERIHARTQQSKEYPPMEKVEANHRALSNELHWMMAILDARMAYFAEENDHESSPGLDAFPPPALPDEESAYAQLLNELNLSAEERLLFILAFAPYFAPALLTEKLRAENYNLRVKAAIVGGVIKSSSMQFVPSMQTWLFLLAGRDWSEASRHELVLRERSPLFREGIIITRANDDYGNPSSPYEDLLFIVPEYVNYLKSGRRPSPAFSPTFPARKLSTEYTWEDLVLSTPCRIQLNEMISWAEQSDTMKQESFKFDLPFVCLFHGAPGTGKTLSTKLLGKTLDREVYRIDLSMIVSKYVGETEKNLALLFDKAENQDWILFFDEADSLFSKRTSVNSANDKWANLEVSYLLQRLEEFGGMAILATNLLTNIEPAMRRRFRYVVEFKAPTPDQRINLWQYALPKPFTYGPKVDLKLYAKEPLTGANIASVLHRARIKLGDSDEKVISKAVLEQALKDELHKVGQTPGFGR